MGMAHDIFHNAMQLVFDGGGHDTTDDPAPVEGAIDGAMKGAVDALSVTLDRGSDEDAVSAHELMAAASVLQKLIAARVQVDPPSSRIEWMHEGREGSMGSMGSSMGSSVGIVHPMGYTIEKVRGSAPFTSPTSLHFTHCS
jgi:hypothetical protein